ncbi:MAG: type II secretion system secretin GspD [Porticoccaceae bacterium]|nr:type II secretion system secretin GspD [Porticoccaceae bacterium]
MRVGQTKKCLGSIKWVATWLISLCFVVEAISAEQVRINFRDADIRSVIESVAEITGESFVLDPRVKGKVTIISPEPIDKSLLYEAILSAIQVQGYQAVKDGVVTRIVPFNQSFGLAGGGQSELVTEILKVRYVQAATLIPVLKPMMSNGARVQAYNQSNYLVVSDIRSNVERLKSLLRELDDPDHTAVEVISLEHISAAEAVHIAGQLKQLQKQNLSLVEDGLNNRVIVSGPGSARTAFKNMLKALDVPLSKKGSVEVIYLNYSRAAELKPVIDGMLQSEIFLRLAGEATSKSKGASKTAYKVEIDELNNALILAAPSAVIREVKTIIDKLDISRPQVLIEAVIAELTENQARSLGADLIYTSKNRGGYLTNFDGVLSSLLGVGLNGTPEASALTSAIGAIPSSAIGLAGNFDPDTGKSMGLLIKALKTDDDTNILSTPSVVTLDNEEATLTSGDEVPFQTGSYTNNSNSSSGNPFTTFNREEVGVLLKVKPQISKGNAVRLEIEQESSKVKGGTEGLQTTSKNTIKTNVMIEDGQLLILGGLIEDTFIDSEKKVPLLGDIPILGRLFKSSSKTKNKKVTMMFIRPTIIRSPEDAKKLSNSRFEHLISRDLNGKNKGPLSEQLQEILDQGQSQETE